MMSKLFFKQTATAVFEIRTFICKESTRNDGGNTIIDTICNPTFCPVSSLSKYTNSTPGKREVFF